MLCSVGKVYSSLLSAGSVALVYKRDVLLSDYPRAYCQCIMAKALLTCCTFMSRVVKISPYCRHIS